MKMKLFMVSRVELSEKQILFLIIGIYIAVFGIFTALRHYNFQTQTWDLAAFVQTFWNTIHGRIMFNTLEQSPNHLGVHWSPWLFLLVPGYAIFQSPYYLIIIQTIAIAFGAWPLYLLAKQKLSSSLSFVIVGAYLLYPPLHWANTYDFHEITFFIPLMLAALYFFEIKKFGWGAVFMALAASVKEDAILAVVFAGIYFFLFKKSAVRIEKKTGLLIAVSAIIYFVLVFKFFMPAFGGNFFRFDRYTNFGPTPGEAVKNVIANPLLLVKAVANSQKLAYIFWLFLPVAFLPFFSWRTFIILIPGLAENLFSNYVFQFNSLYHYDAILVPGIFFSAVYGLKAVSRGKWFLLTAAMAAFLMRSPLNPFNFPIDLFKTNPRSEAFRQLVKMAPPEISVSANTNLVPHLAHREFIYQLGLENALVDLVLIDSRDSFGFKTDEKFQEYADNYVRSGMYDVIIFDDRYVVMAHKKLKLFAKPQ